MRRALDLAQAAAAIRLRGVKRKARAAMLDDLQVMERAALAAIAERRR